MYSVDNSGQHVVKYDDDDVEALNLNNQELKFIQRHTRKSLAGIDMVTLPSNEQELLSDMFTALGNKAFLRHTTQCFHQAPLIKA